jgi:hypothetical protein
MNSRLIYDALNVLMESPFYLGLSLSDRHRLISEFVALYSPLFEDLPEEYVMEEQLGPSAGDLT